MEQSFKNDNFFSSRFSFCVRLAHTEKLEAFSEELEMAWQEIDHLDHLLHWIFPQSVHQIIFWNLAGSRLSPCILPDSHSYSESLSRSLPPLVFMLAYEAPRPKSESCFHLTGRPHPLLVTEFLNLETQIMAKQQYLVRIHNLANRN